MRFVGRRGRAKGGSLLSVGAALAVCVLSLTIGVPGSQAGSRPLATGITVPDMEPVGQLGYDRISQAGASLTRITLTWPLVVSQTEPVDWDPSDPADPNYNWLAFDIEIREAVAAGLQPIVQIASAPQWAVGCKSPEGTGICRPDAVAFASFAAAAAKRYSGNFEDLPRVRLWEPWNEPNLRANLYPQMGQGMSSSAVIYRKLLNRFTAAVKKVDPRNLVVAGGLAPLGGEDSLAPLAFTRQLLCMEGRSHPKPASGCRAKANFDIFAMNPYTSGGPDHSSISPDDVQLGDLPELVALIRAARLAGKIKSKLRVNPVWVTEFSWDSNPPDPGGVPMDRLKVWMAQAMFQSWKSGVSAFFWFSLRDTSRPAGYPFGWTLESGLYYRGDSIEKDRPKATLRVFRFPVAAFRRAGGIAFWGKTPGGKAGPVKLTFLPDGSGSGQVLKSIQADGDGIFHGTVRTRLGSNLKGSVRASFGGQESVPFPLAVTEDVYQPPFG